MLKMKFKKKLIAIVILLSAILSACGFAINCKANDCDEEVYQDGYCRYHYYSNIGENFIKDLINFN